MFHDTKFVAATGWKIKSPAPTVMDEKQNALGDLTNFREFTTCSNLTASCFSPCGFIYQ